MTGASSTDLRFESPGPGTWELDPVHFPRPVTQYWTEIHPPAYTRGVEDFMAYYGTLLEGISTHYINGFSYRQVVLVADEQVPERFAVRKRCGPRSSGATSSASGTKSPSPVRLPNTASSRRSIRTRSAKPSWWPTSRDVVTTTRSMISQHMRYTGAAMLSIGDLLAHVGDWTDVPPAEVLGMMRGTAPVSAGASEQLDQFIAAINEDASAQQLLMSDADPAEVLASCARSVATSGHQRRPTSTSWGIASSTASISPGATHSRCPTCSCGRCAPPWRATAARRPTPKPGSPRSASRFPRNTRANSTRWWPRRC